MEAWRVPGWWPAPARRARVADRLLAAVLLAWAVPDVPWWWRPAGHGASTPAVLGYLVLMLAQSLPFLWWRRVPLLAAGLAAAVFAVRAGLSQDLYSAAAATAAGAFGLGAWGGPRTRLAARVLAGAAAAGAVIVLLTSQGVRVQALPLALLATALGLGEVTAANRDAAAASARLAHDAERSRFARELHDVISHQLSAIAVQAGAARLASRADPAVAVRTVSGIEDIARHGLIELNRIVGAMRRDETEHLDRRPQPRLGDLPDLVEGAREAGLKVRLAVHLDRRPQPRLGDLPDLVEGAREAGLKVRLAVTGSPVPLPAAVELAAYRVVQEGLTNALRYARPAPASVAVSYLGDGLGLAVENGPPPPGAGDRPVRGGGRGLQGLAERAQLLGGSLHAGPRPDGGFAVRAWLPAAP